MADIFISKSTKDETLALSITDVLESNGIDCWISNRDLLTPAGELYGCDIVKAITEAKALLLLLSKNSNVSKHVLNEVSTACDKGKKVFVVQIDDVVPAQELQYYLSQEQWIIDASIASSGNYEVIVKRLMTYINGGSAEAKRFIDEEYIKKENYEKIVKETGEKRHSYTASMAAGKEEEYDSTHFYEKIVRLDVVDSHKNTWSSYRLLTVRNDTDTYTNHLVHKECGEDKADFEKMKIRAWIFENGKRSEKLYVERITEIQPNFEQIFKIHFKVPLAPDDTVTVFYRMDWPNEPVSYYMEELSQSISLLRYRKGVGNLVFAVYEPYKILSSYMMEVTKMNERKESSCKGTEKIIDDEELLQPLHGRGHLGIEYCIENPDGISYQINYRIESDNEKCDDEDYF